MKWWKSITVRKRQSWPNHTAPWYCIETGTRNDVTVRSPQRRCPSFVVSSFCLQGGLSVFILQEQERNKTCGAFFAYMFFFCFLKKKKKNMFSVEPIQGELSRCENPCETERKRVERFKLNNAVQDKLRILETNLMWLFQLDAFPLDTLRLLRSSSAGSRHFLLLRSSSAGSRHLLLRSSSAGSRHLLLRSNSAGFKHFCREIILLVPDTCCWEVILPVPDTSVEK